MKSKILITGASGFIGTRLLPYLEKQGFIVFGYQGSVLKQDSLSKAVSGADTVIHLAARVDHDAINQEMIEVNVTGTFQVIRACLNHKARLIFFSSAAAKEPENIYGLTKSLGEQLLKFFFRTQGLRAVIVRPHNLYNEHGIDRLGRTLDLSQGRHYPITKLCKDVECILQDKKAFAVCRIFEPKEWRTYYFQYWWQKLKRRV